MAYATTESVRHLENRVIELEKKLFILGNRLKKEAIWRKFLEDWLMKNFNFDLRLQVEMKLLEDEGLTPVPTNNVDHKVQILSTQTIAHSDNNIEENCNTAAAVPVSRDSPHVSKSSKPSSSSNSAKRFSFKDLPTLSELKTKTSASTNKSGLNSNSNQNQSSNDSAQDNMTMTQSLSDGGADVDNGEGHDDGAPSPSANNSGDNDSDPEFLPYGFNDFPAVAEFDVVKILRKYEPDAADVMIKEIDELKDLNRTHVRKIGLACTKALVKDSGLFPPLEKKLNMAASIAERFPYFPAEFWFDRCRGRKHANGYLYHKLANERRRNRDFLKQKRALLMRRKKT